MPQTADKTNAMRALDDKGVSYRTHYFSPEIHSAEEVALAVGVPAGQVFKTLVVMPTEARPRPLLAIVPADRELDLKALARCAGAKKLRMALHREAESLTGLLVGGISALALPHKHWRVYLDASANSYPDILVSAGQRGINLQVPVQDLVKITSAKLADIAH